MTVPQYVENKFYGKIYLPDEHVIFNSAETFCIHNLHTSIIKLKYVFISTAE